MLKKEEEFRKKMENLIQIKQGRAIVELKNFYGLVLFCILVIPPSSLFFSSIIFFKLWIWSNLYSHCSHCFQSKRLTHFRVSCCTDFPDQWFLISIDFLFLLTCSSVWWLVFPKTLLISRKPLIPPPKLVLCWMLHDFLSLTLNQAVRKRSRTADWSNFIIKERRWQAQNTIAGTTTEPRP